MQRDSTTTGCWSAPEDEALLRDLQRLAGLPPTAVPFPASRQTIRYALSPDPSLVRLVAWLFAPEAATAEVHPGVVL
jgi:hypothetical protein